MTKVMSFLSPTDRENMNIQVEKALLEALKKYQETHKYGTASRAVNGMIRLQLEREEAKKE